MTTPNHTPTAKQSAPERIWIDAAPHLIADATRHIYVEPPPPHFKDFNSVGYVREDLARVSGDVGTGEAGWQQARQVVLDIAAEYRKEFKPDGSSFSVMKREVCFHILREMRLRESTAPAVAQPTEGEALISMVAAKAAICFMCAKPERYKPAEAIEGSERLFHFQRENSREAERNAGACLANALNKVAIVSAGPTPATPDIEESWKSITTAEREQAIDEWQSKRLARLNGSAPSSLREAAREIVKKISDAAIELAFTRHDLISDEVIVDEDVSVKERVAIGEAFMERVKEDALNCLTGDETGCLDPEELDASNCELIWLQEWLSKHVVVPREDVEKGINDGNNS